MKIKNIVDVIDINKECDGEVLRFTHALDNGGWIEDVSESIDYVRIFEIPNTENAKHSPYCDMFRVFLCISYYGFIIIRGIKIQNEKNR